MFKRLAEDPVLEGDLPQELPAEGSLMTDTYKFSRGTKRADILHQMLDAQKTLIDQIWERRDDNLPIATREEFVTLASIVEKETGRADERSRVASVFLNRLEKGMRLQSDPTIIYGIFGGEGKPADRPISSRTSNSRRPTTPTSSRACRRRRSPIRAVRRWKRSPIRPAPRTSISSPRSPTTSRSSTTRRTTSRFRSRSNP